ncbi:hypothetical protein DL770_010974 [Monosporascus sp. CRB-9-2]|nr:hypothetical protein DL770_010974 [Monosporascus sp. CRB-9-2]
MSNTALSDNDTKGLGAVIGSAIRRHLWEVEPLLITDFRAIRHAPDIMQSATQFIHQVDRRNPARRYCTSSHRFYFMSS